MGTLFRPPSHLPSPSPPPTPLLRPLQTPSPSPPPRLINPVNCQPNPNPTKTLPSHFVYNTPSCPHRRHQHQPISLLTDTGLVTHYRTSSNSSHADGRWPSAHQHRSSPRRRLPPSATTNARRPASRRRPARLYWRCRRLRPSPDPEPSHRYIHQTCCRGRGQQQEQGATDCWH